MARFVVAAVAGIAVGYLTENPQAGFQTFAAVYGVTGFLDPSKKLLGPKLTDLKAPTASYGAPIAYIEGSPRLAGNYIWASDKRAVPNTTSEGKGGPGVDSTTFTYEMDVLIELSFNECEELRRAFSNGKLVWSNADDADDETLSASVVTNAWRELRFYDGNASQMPDPTYEAAVGVGNAPAYRTRTTLMIVGLNLGGSGQVPILTWEVLSEAVSLYRALPLATTISAIPYAPASGISAYSISEPFYTFAAYDVDLLGGHVNSFQVYKVESIGAVPQSYNLVDLGFHNYAHVTMLGNSDESLYVVALIVNPGIFDAYTIDGLFTRFDLTAVYAADIRFSKVGDDVVFLPGGNTIVALPGNDAKLRRFSYATGVLQATAAVALPTASAGCAIGGAYVYSLSYDGANVYKSDLATLSLVATYPIDAIWNAGTNAGHIMCDGSDVYVMGAGTNAWANPIIKWNGSAWEIVAYRADVSGGPAHAPDPVPSLSTIYQAPSGYGAMSVVDGVVFGRVVGANYDVGFLSSTVALSPPTLDQVVRRLCLRAGMADADIDVTDLSHDVAIADGLVRSMAITQVSTARASLEDLRVGYLFDAVEAETLKFVRRGAASALTIPYADLGAAQDDKGEPLPIRRSNDIEIAARVSVKYANVSNDSQDGLEQADRLVTGSRSEQVIELPLGFLPSEAKKLADANTLDLAVSLMQPGPILLTHKYAKLQPTDVVTVTDEYGNTFRVRIVKVTAGSGVSTCELVLDDATVINSAAETDEDYASSTLISLLASTELEMFDIPALSDSALGPGSYAAFAATGKWGSAELDRSPDDSAYTKVLDVGDRAVMGVATTTLGDYTGIAFDEVNAVTVDVGDGTLASTTRDLMLTSNENAFLVGAEVIQFRTATYVSPGVYTLTGLRRGLRGTEWAIPDHASDERVLLLQTLTGIRRVDDEFSDLNVPYFWKAVTHGKSRASAESQSFADTGVSLKPFAPVDFHYDPLSATPTITWHRRSRVSGRFLSTVDPPLGEASEAYDVEHRDSSDVLLESATVTTPSFTAAAVASGDYITVWQRSSLIGRGYPTTITF